MISVVPREVAEHYATYGMVTILPVELPTLMANPGIITKKSKPVSPTVQKFIHHLHQQERVTGRE
ncbi:MAG: hypothetical protein QMC09_06865 [Thauera sp.]